MITSIRNATNELTNVLTITVLRETIGVVFADATETLSAIGGLLVGVRIDCLRVAGQQSLC